MTQIVKRWVALGWPEPDTDSLPHFDSYEEAVDLCENREAIKLDAERRARAAYKERRTGKGNRNSTLLLRRHYRQKSRRGQ